MAIKITIKKDLRKDIACPEATQDLELNTKNRDAAIQADHIQYGPLNLADQDYYTRAAEHWNEPESESIEVKSAKRGLTYRNAADA